MADSGQRIKELREKSGKSQKDFAKIIGISNVVLSRYESNERRPDYDLINKMADYFDVSTDYLLGRTNVKYRFNPDREYGDFENDFLKDPILLDFLQTDLKDATPEEIEKLRAMYQIIKNT